MQKFFLFGIVMSVVLSGCSLGNKLGLSSPTPVPSLTSSVVGTPVPSPQEIEGSLFSLLNSGDKKCTWTSTQSEQKIDGVAFVSGKKFRAEMSTKVNFLPVTVYVVGDGTNATGWASVLPGKKFNFSYAEMEAFANEATSSAKPNDPSVQEVEKLMKDYKFRCETWTVDTSKFKAE